MRVRRERRTRAVQQWLARRAERPIARLALLLFRRYFEASQNSGSAATVYIFLSVAPFLLAATGLFHAAGGDTTVLAQRLIDHQHLTGDTARLVRETFGTASNNALAASISAVIGFLLWGIGIGQIYQDVYSRAWRIQVRTPSDQVRFTIWFFVLSGALVLFILLAGTLKKSGWAVVIPAWLAASTAFWLGTPYYLLRGNIALRALLPGALLATIVIGGATATSPLFFGPSLDLDGKHFGSFGVVLALLAWGFVLAVISMVCAVFSPVWGEWRQSLKHPSEAAGEPHHDAALANEVDA